MSDDMLVHFASNSSNQSDNSLTDRLALLEARMVGKSSSVPAPPPPPVPAAVESQQQQSTRSSSSTMFAGIHNGLQNESLSSDSDDTASEYLIQANTQKRRKYDEEGSEAVSKHVESVIDTPQKIADTADATRPASESNRKRQSRGRGQSSSGRGRGSRASEQSKSQTVPPSNGQSENFSEKEVWPKEQLRQNNFSQPEEEITALREKVAALEESLRKSQNLTQQLEKELKDIKDVELHMKSKRMKALSDLLISVSKAEREEARRKVSQDSLRLGNVKVIRAGTIISETWEDGQALKDLNARLKNLLEVKEAMERQKKALKKRQPDKGDGTDSDTSVQEDLFYQDEMWKSRLAGIKREEEAILRKRDRYELKKARLIREMKRIRDEDDSRFNNFQILNHRYALLNLLGKGGFSEVYKAFDLLEYRYVACKLHGLNAQWSEEKKQSYIRHAIREYNIHKTLVHNNIVRLWDIFEIDNNTFCTVLEYCSEKDLDAVLKLTPNLPEKEARSIISEIFQGLVYLNKRAKKIIHYDLKPGNVLFDELKIPKMTDFGLSKILEDDVGSQGMELTSQGAGTYWYLPPECFELNKTPFISSKVDVWSAGVLYYQMLFGRRPFGHDQSQERILREDTIINARKVEFPSRPPVSNEAKEFIRRCLTYNQADRPDVLTVAQDPYVSFPKK